MIAKLKTVGLYALILVAGLGAGMAVAKIPALIKKPYVEGDYAAYYPNKSTQVVLYGTDVCPYCAKARAYFKENKIAFLDMDIGSQDKAKEDFKRLGGMGVPLILIGGRRIEGFNQPVIEDSIKALQP